MSSFADGSISDLDIANRPGVWDAPIFRRLENTFVNTWDLGFTSFGGPPVHFHIFHHKFVKSLRWINDATYQELFAICQALPGPASTKLGFCISLVHAGFLPALLEFVLWCLPGAAGMYAAAVGIKEMPETLPGVFYSLLTGMNAATVGIIAVAATTLSESVITDNVTRILVIGSACASLLYSALWYFPLLMFIGATTTLVWDSWTSSKEPLSGMSEPADISRIHQESNIQSYGSVESSRSKIARHVNDTSISSDTETPLLTQEYETEGSRLGYGSTRLGVFLVSGFIVVFVGIMLFRLLHKSAPTEFKIFSNLFLVGTIIFGGGPVVVPLLQEYIVGEGWVSLRDFLIGLALIQAFPGPQFNFAVFLAALAASSTSSPELLVAFLGFLGIFTPGIILATGVTAMWGVLRKHRHVTYVLRGVNASAIGLVWTTVYRLWVAGYLKSGETKGSDLGEKPLWVVISTLAFSGNRWFGLAPPLAIIGGGCIGLIVFILTEHKS